MSDELLTRQVDFTLTRADEDGDGLTLEGYAAVFNTATRIDSWEGKFDEIIAPGAFKKTLTERGDRVVLQFDHGQHPFIGSMPIGRIDELSEDARGLKVRARLFDNDLIRPVRDAIDGEAIKGMSFRFNVMADEWDDSGDIDVRTIREVKLHEIGPVVFPAYEDTTVGVRSDVTVTAAQFVHRLHTDQDFRHEASMLLAAAPELVAALTGTTDEGRTTTDDAAEPHVVDRTDEHTSVLDRIRKHIPQGDAA